MTKVEKYVTEAIAIANDNSHGYSMQNRNGDPDYDCSSLVCAVVHNAGIPVKSKGASYTGNMYGAFIACGFKDVTRECNLCSGDGMIRGDILLNVSCHTCIYIGNKQIVHARTNSDGRPGDSCGDEIRTQCYWNFPWDYVLRYPADDDAAEPSACEASCDNYVTSGYMECVPNNNPNYPEILKYGDEGKEVSEMQAKLNALGYNCGAVDGVFGDNTLKAVKKFQKQKGLLDDSEAGPLTLGKLSEFYKVFTGKTTALETITVSACTYVPTGEAPCGEVPISAEKKEDEPLKVGDTIMFTGDKHYISSDYNIGFSCKPGLAKITGIKLGAKHPIHAIRLMNKGSTVYGWVDMDTVKRA